MDAPQGRQRTRMFLAKLESVLLAVVWSTPPFPPEDALTQWRKATLPFAYRPSESRL